MKRLWVFALCIALLASVRLFPRAAYNSVYKPNADQDYTSSREVDRLQADESGTLWATTEGGILRFQNGIWKKFTTAPSELVAKPEAPIQWGGQNVKVTLDGLQIGSGKSVRFVALPASSGTHISAILLREKSLWAALFGDGLWNWDGKNWSHLDLKLPSTAREITALAQSEDGKTVWVGTRRQGIWTFQNNQWKRYLPVDEPFAHNVQFLQSFRGAVWASTLEDGVVVRDANGWKHYSRGVMSSNAPRQMVVFKDKLYVRHSNEVVDSFDGTTWLKNVFPSLPRKQIISLAADKEHLYLGQWGGWSEWDGTNFSHYLKIPELQIVPLIQLFPDGKKLFLGTENRGLFEWDRELKKVRVYDERNGLPDDWITSIGHNGKTLFAGTFNGGLAWKNEGMTNWQTTPELNRVGITALVPFTSQETWVATRFGLYASDEHGNLMSLKDKLEPNKREIQALLSTPNGLWLGTRNGLIYRTHSTLKFSRSEITTPR